METIEERLKEMELHRVQKKWEELSSQEYDKYRTVQYKKRKATLPKITIPAVVEICDVRDKYPDDSYQVVMEDCVNNNLDETHRDISEHDVATNMDATKTVIEKFPDGHDDDDKKTSEGKKGEIHRVISEKVT